LSQILRNKIWTTTTTIWTTTATTTTTTTKCQSKYPLKPAAKGR